jgi:isoleucyl-tRNA synthetase
MKKENSQFDFIKNEHNILKLWQDGEVFKKMQSKNEGGARYRFLDGPITANGSMCMHHVWGRTLKDAFIKYKTLAGFSQQYQNGFDAHGMPVEVEVEKELGLGNKQAIIDYGLDNFTNKCIERVDRFAKIQTNQSVRLGQIMDWDNSYFTNSDENITSIWYFLKKCFEKGWLERSYKSMPWCPRCGTSLSEHEMTGSYRELTHKAVFIKLEIKDYKINGKPENAKILVWTTTPWTLSSNVAVAVNPENTYVAARVKTDSGLLIVGKEAIKVLGKDAEIVAEFKGSELVGAVYTAPLKDLTVQDFEHKIIPWSDVSATDGSGAVHIAPGCGAEDFELGNKLGLRSIVPIDDAGIFTSEFDYLAGKSTIEVEPIIFEKLKQFDALHYTHDFSHNYPFCWRCKTNVVFKLVSGWDIKTAEVKPLLFKAIRDVKWEPAFLQKSMENWLENMGDWNISRRRFYGLPLPIYPCDCGHVTVVGSREELAKLSSQAEVDALPHLHRPYIDQIKIRCAKCSKPVERVPEVGDCWLDAGIAPFSTKKYFTDKAYFKQNFPSEVVLEMKEQIRLWFYSLLFMSAVLEGRAPYERVVGYSTMLDEDGKKFSKTGPKNIKFDDAAEQIGADVMRYVFAAANPSNDMRFGFSMAEEARRKLIAFWNNYVFFNTYAVVDRPDVQNHVVKNPDATDKWLIEKLNQYITDCTNSYDEYKTHNVITATEDFVDDLSNFYIRVNRRRFWKSENNESKLNAYTLLYRAIKAITVVMSPITPFISEYIWQGMVRHLESNAPEFCQLATFPSIKNSPSVGRGGAKGDGVGVNTIESVNFVKKVISLALRLRSTQGLMIKQPIRTMYIKTDKTNQTAVTNFMDILRNETNVLNIEIVNTEDKFNIPYLIVNFRAAGAVLGKQVQDLKNTLSALSDSEMSAVVASFDKGKVSVGEFKNLSSDLFEKKLKSKTEFVSETEGDITVVLDTTMDDELLAMGTLRELIRGIQVARQDAGLEITDRIQLGLVAKSKDLRTLITNNSDKICAEVLATELTELIKDGHKSKCTAGDEEVTITFKVSK